MQAFSSKINECIEFILVTLKRKIQLDTTIPFLTNYFQKS